MENEICTVGMSPEFVFAMIFGLLVLEAYLGKTTKVQSGSLLELLLKTGLSMKPKPKEYRDETMGS